jgi:hypothetical protein
VRLLSRHLDRDAPLLRPCLPRCLRRVHPLLEVDRRRTAFLRAPAEQPGKHLFRGEEVLRVGLAEGDVLAHPSGLLGGQSKLLGSRRGILEGLPHEVVRQVVVHG